jgi:hypothetical protein
LDCALNIGELGALFGKALLHITKIIADAGNLTGSGIELRAVIRLHILHGLLNSREREAEFVIGIGLLLDESFQDREVLGERGGRVFLSLLDFIGAVEQFDNFLGGGVDGGRREKRSADKAPKHARCEHENYLTLFHESLLNS